MNEHSRHLWRALRQAVVAALLLLPLATTVRAQSLADCPVANQPYSANSLMVDLLKNPAALFVLRSNAPAFMSALPPPALDMSGAGIPAVASPLAMAARLQLSLDADLLQHALAAVPVTEETDRSRCARYDYGTTRVRRPAGRPALLVFDRTTGVRDQPAIAAAAEFLRGLAEAEGWSLIFTSEGSAISEAQLSQVDVVVWNNVSGDVLSLSQREALRGFIEQGGGFVGLHGAGGDYTSLWDWYARELIGAEYIGHPHDPQFQPARVDVMDPRSAITRGIGDHWTMTDEWYSFRRNPAAAGAHVLLALDEATYTPVVDGLDLRMGDHPIAWTRCVGDGRAFYSALGHRPETYSDPQYETVLRGALNWTIGKGETVCAAGVEIAAQH